MPVGVLIREEQALFEEILRSLLSRSPEIEILKYPLRKEPDIVILGVKELSPASISKLEEAHREFPKASIIFLFSFWKAEGACKLRDFLKTELRGGAFLSKLSINSTEELYRIIQEVIAGKMIFDPQLFTDLFSQEKGNPFFLEELTTREKEILSLMAQGYKNAAIARILSLELKTVEHYINSIFSKLNNNCPELKHPRVWAVLSYLRATGKLIGDPSK